MSYIDIKHALIVQTRVIHALILRETKTRYGKHKLGYLWALFEPVLQIAVFVAMFTLGGHKKVSDMPIILFILTGVTPFMLFRNTLTQGLNAIDANRALLTFPQVKTFDLVAARGLLEIATMVVVSVILLLTVAAMDYPVRIENPLQVVFALILLAMTGFGLGMTFASLTPLFPSINQVVQAVLGRPLFFTSGLFFTAEVIPQYGRDILLLNPILHMIEMLRSAFFFEFNSSYASPSFAMSTALVCVCTGLVTHRALHNKVLKT
jgi:capsular polysaccharide transport system permease protein